MHDVDQMANAAQAQENSEKEKFEWECTWKVVDKNMKEAGSVVTRDKKPHKYEIRQVYLELQPHQARERRMP